MAINSFDVSVSLSNAEKEMIRKASEDYQKNLEDVFKKLKGNRLLETVDSLTPREEKDSNSIWAKDISAVLLTRYNLVPVDGPCFIDIDGQEKGCEAKEVKLDSPVDFVQINLQLIDQCLKAANFAGWKYFMGIFRTDSRFYIRGCE